MFKFILIFVLIGCRFAFADIVSPQISQIKEISLFEYGFFIGGLSMPDYPASDQSRFRTLPLPVIRYHGDLFRADDEDGTRFRMINNKHIDLDLSFGGSFPTETGNSKARQGMPELDWTAEIGPRLLYYFYRNKDDAQIRMGIPFRNSFSTDLITWKGVGQIFAPTLQIDKYNFLTENLDLFINFTFNFINKGQADYFYKVDTIYSTAERPAYEAKAGTLSYDIDLALKYIWNKKTFIIATRYNDFSQSANSQSPLHRNSVNWTFFAGISWIIGESSEKVLKK